MNRIIAAALGATLLATPARADEGYYWQWWWISRTTFACEPAAYSPAAYYRFLEYEGLTPRIVDDQPPQGRIIVAKQPEDRAGLAFYRGREVCEQDLKRITSSLENYN